MLFSCCGVIASRPPAPHPPAYPIPLPPRTGEPQNYSIVTNEPAAAGSAQVIQTQEGERFNPNPEASRLHLLAGCCRSCRVPLKAAVSRTLVTSQRARWPRVAAVLQPDGHRFNSPNSQLPVSQRPSGQKLLTCRPVRVHLAWAELQGGVARHAALVTSCPWCVLAPQLIA